MNPREGPLSRSPCYSGRARPLHAYNPWGGGGRLVQLLLCPQPLTRNKYLGCEMLNEASDTSYLVERLLILKHYSSYRNMKPLRISYPRLFFKVNVKVKSLCLTKHHAIKTFWGNGGIASLFYISTKWR
jgi:hypothetical protein